MANTTFSGPILAGGIKNTTGTTIGSDIKNTGYVLMSQTEAVDQTAVAGTTTMVIPAKRKFLGMFWQVFKRPLRKSALS